MLRRGQSVVMMECNDDEIIKKFKENDFWGLCTGINLIGCNLKMVRDPKEISDFAIKLCDLIEMKRYGDPVVVHFGREELAGYTLMQLIETSSLVAHFVDDDGSGYIDVFSCKEYGPNEVANFCKRYFNAEQMTYNVFFR